MIRHPYTLEHVAQALQGYCGATLVESYSQEKLSVVLRFEHNGADVGLTCSVDPLIGSILPSDTTHRARKNTLDRFPSLLGQRLAAVTKHPSDRIVTFWFTTHQMHVLLFGGPSANIVITEDGTIVDALHDKTLIGTAFAVQQFASIPFESFDPASTVHKALASCDLLLGNHYAEEALYRANIDGRRTLESLTDDERKVAWRHGMLVCDEARATSTYYLLGKSDQTLFALLPLAGYTIEQESDALFVALRSAVVRRHIERRTSSLRKAISAELERDRHRLERSIRGMTSDAATTDRASVYREYGSLLLTLPPSTPLYEDAIDVQHWDGQTVSIRVDPKRTVIENAHRYFDKARSSEEAARVRAIRLPKAQRQLQRIDAELQRVATASLRELESLKKTMEPSSGSTDATSKYRVFELDEDYVLYVGKSAANNDELTMRFAKQNDLWLHARGVSGSHAVLRGPASDRPPKKVLEQAAAITAYYSNARNASYTPVVYTLRKYVRKPKGANVGAVTLERESVIMVKPSIPSGRED